jgi:hypothetical protein
MLRIFRLNPAEIGAPAAIGRMDRLAWHVARGMHGLARPSPELDGTHS